MLFVEGPPPRHAAMPYFDCTSSVAAPVLDTVWAGLNGAGALIALGSTDAELKMQNQTNNRGTVIGVGLAWLALSGVSAVRGYQQTSDCREAKAQLALRLTRPSPTRRVSAPVAPPLVAPVTEPDVIERCQLEGTPAWTAADPVEKQRLLRECWDRQRGGPAPAAPPAPPPSAPLTNPVM